MVCTSAELLDCEKVTWTIGTGNTITGNVESTGCCMQIQNFNTANSAQFDYPVSPKAAACTLEETESAGLKLIQKIEIGNDRCLVIAVCRQTRQGLLVMCRQQSPESLFDILIALVRYFLLKLLTIPGLQFVNQTKCFLENNNCVV